MSSPPGLSPSAPAFRAAMARWARKWDLAGLEARVTVEWSPRLRRSAGRSFPERGIVRLAGWLARADQDLRLEVLCHELAHIALHERHGRHAKAHGKEWAALVCAAGFSPTARLDERQTGSRAVPHGASSPPQPRAIYRHRCPVCQMERLARRAVRRWLCRACIEAGLEGRLEIERLASRDAPMP